MDCRNTQSGIDTDIQYLFKHEFVESKSLWELLTFEDLLNNMLILGMVIIKSMCDGKSVGGICLFVNSSLKEPLFSQEAIAKNAIMLLRYT